MATTTKVLAREAFKTFEIKTGDDPETFTDIAGIESLTLNFQGQNADTSDYDSDGWGEHLVAERTEQIVIAGHIEYDDPADESPTRDPGQVAVEDLARKTGVGSLGEIRLTLLDDSTITWVVSATLGAQGGARAAKAQWGVTFDSSGEPEIGND